jgi:hypothetical protein
VSWWLIGGIVLAIAIVLALVFTFTSMGRAAGATVGRALSGARARAPDMTFSVDSSGRYPGDAGWVDEDAGSD